jgi:Spy/CpxP family protein refolding chaperone
MTNPLFTAGIGVVCGIGFLAFPLSALAQAELHQLLRSSRNVAEIGLSDQQKSRIDDFRRQLSDRKSQMRKLTGELERDTQDRIMAVLTGRQRERLSQLYYQNRGPRALEDTETAKVLRLTDEQRKKILEIRQEAREAYRKDRRNYNKIIKARNEKYLTVLTPRQRARWDKMLGPPRKKELSLTSEQQRDLWSQLRKIAPLTERRYAEELKITDRQREQIRDLSRQLWMNNSELKKIEQQYGERYDRAAGERQKERIQQEMAAVVGKLYERGIRKIDAVLTGPQRDRLSRLRVRLDQRRYRSLGTAGLPRSAEIAEKLGLTETQKERMKALQQAAREAELKEQRESRERIERFRDERNMNYLKVLTPKQRAQWEKMLGQPLILPKPDI